jgi:drug/metabolite transporter (DMT)-like permease
MDLLIPTIFGLFSAISFGFGDFSGGYFTRNTNVLLVLIYSQLTGFLFIFLLMMAFQEVIVLDLIFFNVTSGIFGGIGLLFFYHGLSHGNMAIVAPIVAVITPIIPLFYSFLNFTYNSWQLIGIPVAFIAIFLVSKSKIKEKISLFDIKLAILAGIGFGMFLLFIDLGSSETSIFFPIIVARISSIIVISIITIYLGEFKRIPLKNIAYIGIVGILDTTGNLFFILSSKSGRLDIATILLSMGPVVTVILAWKLLHEKLTKTQIIGILLSIVAVILLSN